MTKLGLTFACCRYDRTEALREGDVQVEGIALNCLTMGAGREIFDRMVGGLEFEVAELSSSEFISLAGAGDDRFVAMPVFPSRVFRHGYVFYNRRSGIKAPKDLAGKRIGVPLYTQTAAIWARGLLADDGVDLDKVHWVQGAVEQSGTHGKPAAPPLLKPVAIEQNESRHSLDELLALGEIDALLGSRKPASIGKNPDVARLYPDYRAIERDFYLRTKIFPIMHLIAIRRDVYERYPWVANSLYRAFVESKRRGDRAAQACRLARHHAAVADGRASKRSTRCSAAMLFPMASKPTGRRSKRSCATWWSSISSRRR